jgi:hypothetical protein
MMNYLSHEPTAIPPDALVGLDGKELRIDHGNSYVVRYRLSVLPVNESAGASCVRALRLGGGHTVVNGGIPTFVGADCEYFYLTETAVRKVEHGLRGADLRLTIPS